MSDAADPARSPISRRSFLGGGAALVGAAALASTTRAFGAPALVRAGRPMVVSGVQAGDVSNDGAVLWAQTDRPARMWARLATTPNADGGRVVRGPLVGPDSAFTGQVLAKGLPPGRGIAYEVWFVDQDGVRGPAEQGSFRSAPRRADHDVTFVFTADCVGQGWGINPDLGGMIGFEAMRSTKPDFFVFSGDTIYADGPLLAAVTLPDGRVWHNVVTPAKSKVAETLDEFRGQWAYNLMDDNLRRFNAEVPVIAQWDDHEVHNNWYPGQILEDTRYTERRVDVLAARASRGFHEYFPLTPDRPGPVHRTIAYGPLLDVFVLDMRTFRGPNTSDREPGGTPFLGPAQLAWLQHGLRTSKAAWKVIAADMPLGLVVPDGPVNIEAVANGDPGTPLGRELEFATLLSGLKRDGVRNVVWLTADVHYTAAHRYDPAQAAFTDFDPFWEFVAGPINAGTFGPNTLDDTFGPQLEFAQTAATPNQSPLDGRQYFGHASVSDESMTVALRNIAGEVLHTTEIPREG
jgi:alkaline phosphatase D